MRFMLMFTEGLKGSPEKEDSYDYMRKLLVAILKWDIILEFRVWKCFCCKIRKGVYKIGIWKFTHKYVPRRDYESNPNCFQLLILSQRVVVAPCCMLVLMAVSIKSISTTVVISRPLLFSSTQPHVMTETNKDLNFLSWNI